MSVLKLKFHDRTIELNNFDTSNWENMENTEMVNLCEFDIEITQEDIEKCLIFSQL